MIYVAEISLSSLDFFIFIHIYNINGLYTLWIMCSFWVFAEDRVFVSNIWVMCCLMRFSQFDLYINKIISIVSV